MSDFTIELTGLIKPSTPVPAVLATLTQFSDPRVDEELNGQRTASFVMSAHNPDVVHLTAQWAQAARIYYRGQAQPCFWGPVRFSPDLAAGTVTVEGIDSIHLQHHFVRRGDNALNDPKDPDEGLLTVDEVGMSDLIAAAQNTAEQDAREVPTLGIEFVGGGTLYPDTFIGVERGAGVWDSILAVAGHVLGPDFQIEPRDDVSGAYANFITYDKRGSDKTADVRWYFNVVDDPEVPDNAANVVATPLLPVTHAHVLDVDKRYRITRASADESEIRGVFVKWLRTDHKVRKHNVTKHPDTSPLATIAQAYIDAYSTAPFSIDVTLRPDAAQDTFWREDFNVGDLIYVKGEQGYVTLEGDHRITKVGVSEDTSRGLARTAVTVVPDLVGDELDEDS